MSAIRHIQVTVNLLTFGGTLICLLLFSYLRSKDGTAAILGVTIPHRYVHMVLGPLLILINGAILTILLSLYLGGEPEAAQKAMAQSHSKFAVLGPVLNPVWTGNRFAASIGYATLIILWWMGMHAFAYSIGLTDTAGPTTLAWRYVASGIFLVLGLATMLVIQAIWNQWGMDAYRWKWRIGFVGIGVGALGIPLLLRLGQPQVPLALVAVLVGARAEWTANCSRLPRRIRCPIP